MSNRLPYDWFRDSATSVMTRMLIISAVLHVLLIVGVAVWFSRHKAVEPKLINVSLVAAPGPMTPMPGSAPPPPPPPPPAQPGPETAPPEPPKPEPPKPEPKPEPPKPEVKPEPKPEKPKPEPDKPPKPSTKDEKPKKPKKVDLTPIEDPKDEPPKKTPQKTGGKPVPKTKGPTLVGAEPTDNVMPSDVAISMAVGGQTGPPVAMGSWPGLFQFQVYKQWIVPNGIPMNDPGYLPQITVTIGRDGKILEGPTVTKPSPSDALNESCVQALINATLPPFPDNYEEPQVTMVVQFSPMGRQAMGGGAPQPSAPAF